MNLAGDFNPPAALEVRSKTDGEIDRLVHELNELTEEEIRIVEGW
jgi:hypothetical protein